MYVVKVNTAPPDRKGKSTEFFDYYLRGTTWVHRSRATHFPSMEEANAALEKAAKFMHRKTREKVSILPLSDVVAGKDDA